MRRIRYRRFFADLQLKLLLGFFFSVPGFGPSTKADPVQFPSPVIQFQPNDARIRERIGKGHQKGVQKERLEPNKLPREKEKGVRKERRGNRNTKTHKKDRICVV